MDGVAFMIGAPTTQNGPPAESARAMSLRDWYHAVIADRKYEAFPLKSEGSYAMLSRVALLIALMIGAWMSPPLIAADSPAPGVKRSTPVALGDAAPDFTLEHQDGRKVNLAAEWKTRPVVLIFYRGNW